MLVDGVYSETPQGEVNYAPRPQEQLDQIATLVRSAIGFDQARGDVVEVVNLRFAEAAVPVFANAEPAVFMGMSRAELMRYAELAVLLVVTLLVLLLVVRPLVRRILEPDATPDAIADASAPAIEGAAAQGALPAPDGEDDENAEDSIDNKALELIDVAQFNGKIQASTIKRVGDLVRNNPDEAVTIIRQWMNEAA